MKDQKEIAILGAGPGGLSAAIVLARSGKKVHLYERYDKVGKRFQGDFQGLENWSTKEDVLDLFHSFGISSDFEKTPFYDVDLTDGHSKITKRGSHPLFYLVKRGPFADSLDTALCHQAEKAGVEIHYRSTIPLESAHIIATGPIRKAIIAVDKGIVFPTDLPDIAVGIFHDSFAYLGYSYFLVTKGYGSICTVVFKDFHRLNDCFEKTIDMVKKIYGVEIKNAKSVGGLGSFSLRQQPTMDSSLLVGEAAGLQDLLWGFGIRSAITSGYLAAQALLHQKDYAKELQQHLYPGLKASVVNRYLWEKLKWGPYPLLPYLTKLPLSVRTHFHYLYNYSPFHRLLFPLAAKYIKKHYSESI